MSPTTGLAPRFGASQKQLSDVSVRTEELARFITAPIRIELARLEEESAHQAQRVRQSSGTRRRQRQLAQALQRRELEEKCLSEQADALRAGLIGLSEEDRAL
jgi:chromosome segregation protein